jgi:hypothetical protein
MWSSEILEEFPTFTSQYAMELLHSLGSIFDTKYFSNDTLRTLVADYAKRDDQCFYQLALHAYLQLKHDKESDLGETFTEKHFNLLKDVLQQNPIDSVCHAGLDKGSKFVSFLLGKSDRTACCHGDCHS